MSLWPYLTTYNNLPPCPCPPCLQGQFGPNIIVGDFRHFDGCQFCGGRDRHVTPDLTGRKQGERPIDNGI